MIPGLTGAMGYFIYSNKCWLALQTLYANSCANASIVEASHMMPLECFLDGMGRSNAVDHEIVICPSAIIILQNLLSSASIHLSCAWETTNRSNNPPP